MNLPNTRNAFPTFQNLNVVSAKFNVNSKLRRHFTSIYYKKGKKIKLQWLLLWGVLKLLTALMPVKIRYLPKNELSLAAFILGIAIPIAFIYIRDLLDNKIRTPDELEEAGIAVVG